MIVQEISPAGQKIIHVNRTILADSN